MDTQRGAPVPGLTLVGAGIYKMSLSLCHIGSEGQMTSLQPFELGTVTFYREKERNFAPDPKRKKKSGKVKTTSQVPGSSGRYVNFSIDITSWVAWGKTLNLSESQFPCLYLG